MQNLLELSRGVAGALQAQNQFLVLAESCTGGLVAASMTGVPGVSAQFCGSAVVYRETTKMAWLDVSPDVLAQYSAESAETTESLAKSVLSKTPEATISAAVTGHLGPNAPLHDGMVYLCICRREPGPGNFASKALAVQLQTIGRIERQQEAAGELLRFVLRELSQ